jgi:hypothetical protein
MGEHKPLELMVGWGLIALAAITLWAVFTDNHLFVN